MQRISPLDAIEVLAEFENSLVEIDFSAKGHSAISVLFYTKGKLKVKGMELEIRNGKNDVVTIYVPDTTTWIDEGRKEVVFTFKDSTRNILEMAIKK